MAITQFVFIFHSVLVCCIYIANRRRLKSRYIVFILNHIPIRPMNNILKIIFSNNRNTPGYFFSLLSKLLIAGGWVNDK